jgi:hypothetical protein
VTRHVTRDDGHDATAKTGLGSPASGRVVTADVTRYVERDVTQAVHSPFCSQHPNGTPAPCRACARARTALEASLSPIWSGGWDCSVDGHDVSADGTCVVCLLRPV